MKKVLLYIFILGFIGEMIVLFSMYKRRAQERVLGEAIVATVSPSPTPLDSPTPSPTNTPTIKPTPVITSSPSPSPIPQPEFTSQQIYEFIERFAAQYGVSPDILRHLAICESGFNPMAQNLSYSGLFQFGPITWKKFRLEMGENIDIDLRFNAEEAVQTASYVLQMNKAYIWPNCTP
ncbi:transglycosylase SLT domain-containing protein [Candidatus Microgenomates bacterium]|nr:transglycosylase SLT domain-containing protein [Candidatus Microgenomates bacterium]